MLKGRSPFGLTIHAEGRFNVLGSFSPMALSPIRPIRFAPRIFDRIYDFSLAFFGFDEKAKRRLKSSLRIQISDLKYTKGAVFNRAPRLNKGTVF